MTILQIQYFVDICDCMSFSAAAKKNFVSQPAISNIIKELEQSIGCTLFIRNKSKLRLTPDAEVFLRYSRDFLNHYRFLSTVMQKDSSERALIRIGASPILSSLVITQIHKKINAMESPFRISLIERTIPEIAQSLELGIIDVALIYPQQIKQTETLGKIDLITRQNNVICAHKNFVFRNPEHISIEELRGIPLALFGPNYSSNSTYRELCIQSGFEPNVICESEQIKTLEMLVQNGLAVAFLDKSLFQNNPDIRFYTFENGPYSTTTVSLFYKKEAPPAVREFVHLFAQNQ